MQIESYENNNVNIMYKMYEMHENNNVNIMYKNV